MGLGIIDDAGLVDMNPLMAETLGLAQSKAPWRNLANAFREEDRAAFLEGINALVERGDVSDIVGRTAGVTG